MRGIPDLAAVYIGFLIGFGVEGAPTPVCLISATQLEDYGTRRILMLLVRWQTQRSRSVSGFGFQGLSSGPV